MYELQAKAASGAELSNVEKLRLELFEKVNALGIGAQGLGGLTAGTYTVTVTDAVSATATASGWPSSTPSTMTWPIRQQFYISGILF